MATVTTNDLIEGLRGKLGKSLVFRTMHDKTFVSHRARKPDKKKESEAQRNTRVNFKQASEWAKKILRDPEQKAYYQKRAKVLRLPNAYTAAITDYMRKPKVIKTQDRGTITYRITKPGFALNGVRVETTETTDGQPKIVTYQQNDSWRVHYTPGDGAVLPPTLIITDKALREYKFVDVPV